MSDVWLTPGPTAVPDAVLEAQGRHPIFHRGEDFRRLLAEVTDGLRWLLQTRNDVLVLTASGTGALEAAIVNCFSPGERIVVCVNGVFGERVARIAARFGLDVELVAYDWGRVVRADDVAAALARRPDARGVVLQHAETSTGVVNDLAAVAEVVEDPLLVVDAISAAGALPVRTDELGLDVVCGAAQKGLGATPGIAFVSMSEKAWDRHERASCPRHYWDFSDHRAPETPWTPAVSVLEGLAASLRLLRPAGLDDLFERHRVTAAAVKDGVRALGLEPFGERAEESVTVTAARPPTGVHPKDLVRHLHDRYGVLIAPGLGPLSDEVFRIGHLGHVAAADVIAGLAALEATLADLAGTPVSGAAVAAATERYRAAGRWPRTGTTREEEPWTPQPETSSTA